MRGRWPLAGLAATVAIVVIALVDHAITVDGLPPIDPSATVSDPAVAERIDTADAFNTRAWIYALALVVAICATTLVAWRNTPPGDRAEVSNDLGVVGVAFGLVTWLIYAGEPALISDSSGESALWLPMLTMLLIAGGGRLAVVFGGSPGEPQSGRGRGSLRAVAMAIGSLPALLRPRSCWPRSPW